MTQAAGRGADGAFLAERWFGPPHEEVTLLVAFFPRRADARTALGRLAESGVPPEAISHLPKEVAHLQDLGVRAGTKAAAGAALGFAFGAAAGATFCAIAAGGSLVFPGLGVVLAGPFVAAFAGAGAVGTLFGVVGAAFGSTRPAFEADVLDDAVSSGGALLCVRCAPSQIASLEELLLATGALRVDAGRSRRSPRA